MRVCALLRLLTPDEVCDVGVAHHEVALGAEASHANVLADVCHLTLRRKVEGPELRQRPAMCQTT